MARKVAKAKSSKTTSAPKAEAPALVPGTVLKKLDRKGKTRCECTVEADGYRYRGTVFTSLSAAAGAAAKDIGLKGKSFNGYVFWGLAKPGRVGGLDRLEHLWNRYSSAAVGLLKSAEKAAALEREATPGADQGRNRLGRSNRRFYLGIVTLKQRAEVCRPAAPGRLTSVAAIGAAP